MFLYQLVIKVQSDTAYVEVSSFFFVLNIVSLNLLLITRFNKYIVDGANRI